MCAYTCVLTPCVQVHTEPKGWVIDCPDIGGTGGCMLSELNTEKNFSGRAESTAETALQLQESK